MAVIETLELRFQANLGKVNAQLNGLASCVSALGAALEGQREALATGAAALVQSVAEALRSNAGLSAAPEEAGRALAGRFALGILSGQTAAAGAAQSLCSAARFSGSGAVGAAHSAGAALGQGFANGISSQYGAVMRAADRIANAAVSRIRSALRIHSPSKVSYALGGNFGEGFAGGVRDSLRLAEQSAAALSGGAASALEFSPATGRGMEADGEGLAGLVGAAVREALGGTEIVIPLNVDGVKLGEASIRGINLVTRSAGRLLLEI